MGKKFKDSLNSSQKAAVESESSNLLVLAGPGTGKTRLIISKILHLLESSVPAERILAVTFSRKATWEMEERLLHERPDLSGRLQISTLHAFCVELVQRHGFRLGLGRKLELISEAQSQLLFRRLAPRLPFQYFVKSSAIDSVIGDLLSFFQDCKDEGLWPEQVLSFAQSLPEAGEDDQKIKQEWIALGDIYNAFQSHCFDEGLLDFGDAVLGALRLLEDYPIVSRELQSQYDYVLVDEFQDTNWTQIQLLRKICGPQTRICVVGDDDQSIYRFRGASYSAFEFFNELFPNPEVIELQETYRLPPAVAAAATALISQNGERRFRPNKVLKSLQAKGAPIQILQTNDYDEEAQWILAKIQNLLAEGCPPQEIGILVRAHGHADLLSQLLQSHGIPMEASSAQSLFQSETVKDALAFLNLVSHPDDNLSFLRLLDSPFLRLEKTEIFKFCRWAGLGRKNYLDQIEKASEADLKSESLETLNHFKLWLQDYFVSSSKASASEVLMDFLEKSQSTQYLMKNEKSDELRQLFHFANKLVEWERVQKDRSLQKNFNLIQALSSQNILLPDDEGSSDSSPSVKILSVHASKGLEFKHVFVLSLVGRRFPANFRSNTWMLPDAARKEKAPNKESHIDEERRLLYVAMTRAKEQLYLSTISRKGTKPSIFVSQDIEKNLDPPFFNKIEVPSMNLEKKIESGFQKVFSRTTSSSQTDSQKPSPDNLRLSFTQLEKYERCPLSYWFAYDLRVPSLPTPSLLTGSAVHTALEDFYKKVQMDQIPSADDLIGFFEKAFKEQQEEFGIIGEQDLELGRTKLRDFYDAQEENFTKPLALEKDFRLQIGPHEVRGKMDRVDPAGDSVRIIDYKTGKSKSSENTEDQKFAKDSLQFSIYALAAKECFDWKVKELCFYYVYDNQVLTTERSDQELEQTKEKILELATHIQKQNFEPKPGFQCRYCEFNKICPSSAA